MKSIAFFNNKGGVGKTTLIFHVAYMMSELGYKVVVADLDPQANLSSMFLSEAKLYDKIKDNLSITEALKPLTEGTGDIQEVHIEDVYTNLSLIIGNLELSSFEDELSISWIRSLGGDKPSLRKVSAFYRIIMNAASKANANFLLIDMGPNLGAINRAALISADYVVVPVGADLFSVQGMSNVGRALVEWRRGWQNILAQKPTDLSLSLPKGLMQPTGYIVSQHGIKESSPVIAYYRWAKRIPSIYQSAIMRVEPIEVEVENDPNCLALLKHYRSLIPMAMEVNRPIFFLKPADGAIGAHQEAVRNSYADFERLTKKIIERTAAFTEVGI